MPLLKDFHRELRRRKVYRVAVVYAGVAFVVWQVADLSFEYLGLPDVAVTLVLALSLLAFPLALVLAWAYEVHPDSGASAEDAPPAASTQTAEEDVVPATASGAVAVLPFENMSTEPESEYFADGITEELTHALGRMPALRVAARTSAFSFKGQRLDIREIGRRLNVEHVVEGSVRRSGSRLRVTAQLVDSRNGYNLWSDRYEREMDDVFAIQDDIVAAVVQSLRDRLDTEGPAAPQTSRTDRVEAYDLYLRSRHALRAFDGAPVSRTLEWVERSLEIDPSFAPAHALRAEALTTQALGFFQGRTGDLLARARESAERALALDAELPEAHLARALTHLYHDWAFRDARRGLDRAIELNPSYVDAHRWSEFYWTYVERDYDRAKASLARAKALDPVDPRIDVRDATVDYIFGRYEAAESAFRKLVADRPELLIARVGLMDTVCRVDRWEEAGELAAEMPADDSAPDVLLGVTGLILAASGRTGEARRRLGVLESRRERGYALPFWRAVIHAGLGELDEAFRLLDEAIEERDGGLLFLAATPDVGDFHRDPRFGRTLRRIGLGHLAPESREAGKDPA